MPDLSRLEEELKGSATKQEEKNPYKKTDKLDAILSGKLPQKEPQKQKSRRHIPVAGNVCGNVFSRQNYL